MLLYLHFECGTGETVICSTATSWDFSKAVGVIVDRVCFISCVIWAFQGHFHGDIHKHAIKCHGIAGRENEIKNESMVGVIHVCNGPVFVIEMQEEAIRSL